MNKILTREALDTLIRNHIADNYLGEVCCAATFARMTNTLSDEIMNYCFQEDIDPNLFKGIECHGNYNDPSVIDVSIPKKAIDYIDSINEFGRDT